jgi:hypothetical protein
LQTGILNLALNARDAMPEGGTLTIATALRRRAEDIEGDSWRAEDGDQVCIDVCDSGIGMTREILDHAIEPFFTTKEVGKGTGLGLSMVYGATREMGGDVSIDSEPGRGTIVRILLPAALPEPASNDEPEEALARDDAPALGQVSLLCVEDDPLVGAATAEILESAGFRTTTVSNAEKALAVLRERPDIPLVVTDIGLPGMDGWDLISRVRKDRPNLMALFISGYDRASATGHLEPDCRTDYVNKPFDSRDLLRRVQALLASSSLVPTSDAGLGSRNA